MLRTPRARLSAIKYLEKRIPNSTRHAKDTAVKGNIYPADYTIKIINREVTVCENLDHKRAEEARINEMKQSTNNYKDYFYFFYPNK